ncbi:MAG: S41 family peptidase [Patescibacteria group bacterium]|nr:S41 family peptidase [Patescibacteria group bacterium]
MNNKYLKYVSSVVVAMVILGLVFMAGAYAGSKNRINVANINSVDLSPFWKEWSILTEKYVSSKPIPNDQERIWGAMQGLASSMGDPYTVFFPPKESKIFESDIAGNFEGVGMEIALKDQILTVVAPLKGSPAEKAGIKVGDKIVKINATSTIDMSTDNAVSFIRGKKGTIVTLNVFREGIKAPFDVKITRDTIDLPTIDTELRKDGVFVIKLYSFSANSPDLFRNALRQFYESGSQKLILDLRSNPGGYLEASVDMASWFLPSGKIVVTEDFGKNGDDKIYRSRGYNVFSNLHFIILVDGGSASASEILAGALQEHGIVKLVGTKTFGKGSVQELVPITSDTSLKVTVARWLTPKGNSISEGGLKPDYEVKISQTDIDKKIDPQMNKALELLKNY